MLKGTDDFTKTKCTERRSINHHTSAKILFNQYRHKTFEQAREFLELTALASSVSPGEPARMRRVVRGCAARHKGYECRLSFRPRFRALAPLIKSPSTIKKICACAVGACTKNSHTSPFILIYTTLTNFST